METVYTSASFIISCFSGGTNLLDIINVGAASAATPTCMRVTGGIGNSIYYMDSNDVPRRPKVRGVRKIFVTIEEDVAAILNKEQSVSLYVNEAIRYYHDNRR